MELIHKYDNINNIILNFDNICKEFLNKTGKYLKISENFNFESVRKIYNTSYDKEFLLQKIGYICFNKIKSIFDCLTLKIFTGRVDVNIKYL